MIVREAKHFKKHEYNNGKSAIPRKESITEELIMKLPEERIFFLGKF